jgi:8-amino-7-oxononanoate synthase
MFKRELAQLEKEHLLRQLAEVDRESGAYVTIRGKRALLMCTNDYLGLAVHPALKEAAVAAIERYGFGSGASRLVSGTGRLHSDLEERIARFKGTEAALVFNSGYAANTGIIPALAEEGDLILSDSLNHASIIDGCRLSKAQTCVYRHRDSDHVESILVKNAHARRKLIVTDGVFSMDGDLAPLPELALLAEKYGALLMVDDAHATGVLGNTGRGSAEHFGLKNRVRIQMGTFSKALGSFGAYVAGDKELIDYLLNRSRSFIFSTALPPAVCAASIAALDIVEGSPEIRERLWRNQERFARGLESAGIRTTATETPIVPLVVGDALLALNISQQLLEQGIFATAIRPPTVPENAARIRTTVTAAHSQADIEQALQVFGKLKQAGLL